VAYANLRPPPSFTWYSMGACRMSRCQRVTCHRARMPYFALTIRARRSARDQSNHQANRLNTDDKGISRNTNINFQPAGKVPSQHRCASYQLHDYSLLPGSQQETRLVGRSEAHPARTVRRSGTSSPQLGRCSEIRRHISREPAIGVGIGVKGAAREMGPRNEICLRVGTPAGCAGRNGK